MWFDTERSTLDWTSDAPESFHNEAILEATPDEVFALLADTDSWARWFPEFEGAYWLTDGEPGVGARRVAELDIMDVREEFLAWEPGERFAFTVTGMTLPLATRLVEDYRMAPHGDGQCEFTWDVYFEPRWFLRPFGFLLRHQFGTMFEEATASLVDYVRRTA